MITLNLLPPEEKNVIAERVALGRILTWGGLAFISIIIFLLLLSSIWWSLLIQLNSLKLIVKNIESSPQAKTIQELQAEIKDINQKMKDFDQLSGQTKNYSSVLEKITELVPDAISLEAVTFNQNKVVLEGLAANRTTLLGFHNTLSMTPEFEKLEKPLSDFLKETNIDFSFNFLIKK